MDQKSIKDYSVFLKTRGYAEHTIHLYSQALEKVPDTWDTENTKYLYEHINSTLKKIKPTLKVTAWHNIRAAARQFFLFKTGNNYKDYVRKTDKQSDYATILNDFSFIQLSSKV